MRKRAKPAVALRVRRRVRRHQRVRRGSVAPVCTRTAVAGCNCSCNWPPYGLDYLARGCVVRVSGDLNVRQSHCSRLYRQDSKSGRGIASTLLAMGPPYEPMWPKQCGGRARPCLSCQRRPMLPGKLRHPTTSVRKPWTCEAQRSHPVVGPVDLCRHDPPCRRGTTRHRHECARASFSAAAAPRMLSADQPRSSAAT